MDVDTGGACFYKQKQIVLIKMKDADNGLSFSIDLIGQIKSRGFNRKLNQYETLILIGHRTGTTVFQTTSDNC